MRIHYICKRKYTNKDLLKDRFGRLFHLPNELSRLGAFVSVNAIDYKNPFIEEFDAGGVVFKSIPASLVKNPLFPFTLYRNALAVKPDIIIASGDSHIGFIAFLIAGKLGARFVFDVYDYYPVFSGNRIPGMKKMFNLSVKGADLVLCASEPLLEKLLTLNSKRLLIENGVDQCLFAPCNMLSARKKLGLASEFKLVGYFGSINQHRGPLLIEACRFLRKEFPLLQLMLAGHVSGVDLDQPWIKYFGELPQAELPQMINACDVVAIPYAKTKFNDMSGACKIAEYLACGKPVVVTRVSNHEQIFGGVSKALCEPTPFSIAEAIKQQLISPETTSFPARLSWEYIGNKLSLSLKALLVGPFKVA